MSNYSNPNEKYKIAPQIAGAFLFVTDQSCHYTIYIKDGSHHLWNTALFEEHSFFRLSFDKKWCDDDDPGLDDAICNTIYDQFRLSMEANGPLGVYYHLWEPDGNDLFYAHFYNEMEELLPDFKAFEFVADDEGEQYPVSLFIHKNYPDKELILEEFRKVAEL